MCATNVRNDYETPPNNSTLNKSAFDKYNRCLREYDLDTIGFEVSSKINELNLFVHSPCKIDGSNGRAYVLGSDRLRARVAELDPNKMSNYTSISPFKKIGLTPPKSCRRCLHLDSPTELSEDQCVMLYDTANSCPVNATAVQSKPKTKVHGVYVRET